MKKKDLPELKLNKRTIANLNSMEMRYVVGGGGDDDLSENVCDKKDVQNEETDTNLKSKIKNTLITINSMMFC